MIQATSLLNDAKQTGEIEEMDVRNSMDVDAKRKRATSVMIAQPRLRACMEVIMKKSQAPG